MNYRYNSDGTKYQSEGPTCSRHNKNGDSFGSHSYRRTIESHWRAQGIFLSYDEYEQLLELQNRKCAICGIDASELKRAIDVDHCHKTGNIRGLVCSQCNAMLGRLEKLLSLDELKDFLEGNVFMKYKEVIIENKSSKSLRSK